MPDHVTLLKRTDAGLLAKTWLPSGEIRNFDNGARHFTVKEVPVSNLAELSRVLTRLERIPARCIVRGKHLGEDHSRAVDPEHEDGKTRRTLELFDDPPHHWMLVEIDNFEPLTADPVLQPTAAIDEFVATCLPPCFGGASYHWQLSNSAGHPTKAGLLKAHVWFWLVTPYSSSKLRAWAKQFAPEIDRSVFVRNQIHYTALPVFADGSVDPAPVRSGFVSGLVGDEVPLSIPDDIEAQDEAFRLRGPDAAGAADLVADYLHEQGLVLGYTGDGALKVQCPWDDEHTSGQPGDSSTVWFLAGTNGYPHGGFKCLHSHCADQRDKAQFLEAVGYVDAQAAVVAAEEFDVVVAPAGSAAEHERPRYVRDKRGKIEPSIENIVKGLSDPIECGMQIRYDEFRAEVVQAAPGTDGWRSFTDADYTRLRIMLERRGFKPIGREIIRDAVWLVADEASFDTAITWIDTLKHDGVPRIDTFMRDYLNAADTPYTRAVSRYMWTALAGRVLDPGCEAPMVPVLIGAQGARKTSSVAAISPARDFFLELKLDGRDEDASRMMRGKLVVELGELKGLRSREAEAIKSFISRRSEEWVPKFKEFSTQLPRRFLFIGTSNPSEILDDDTGERRWLPTMVGQCDPDAITRDRLQLWAEARDAFIVEGIAWQDAERLAPAVHAQHKIQDPWMPLIAEWLDTPDELGEAEDKPADREFLRACDVATGALRLDPRSLRRSEEMQIGKCLRALGYERASARVGQHVMKVWKRKT
ncbi:virulence-associated E family protein [Burkholderia aenigmatica]|uniref:virulence-associated E family protein n=1 Tax=Burkholderia aenigmatica TaxID=2015348 RepID=UPI00264E2EB5|nr:virulence-associated E family protein [Burkholderia aenigmatica]MDN7881416.1 virulence-associated E family protein [Burkholderia aenigmatica]